MDTPSPDPSAALRKAPFGSAVSEWMRVLRTLQKDEAFARSVESNEFLRSIAMRRLSNIEACAVEAPVPDALSHVKTMHGEVLWMMGARHACDALAVRIATESLESPARLAALLEQAREALCDARPMADHLAVWDQHEEMGPTYVRLVAAVTELETEVARHRAIADSLFVGGDLDPHRSPADQRLTEWTWVLHALGGSWASWPDPCALVEQTRTLVEGLVTRFSPSASRDLVRATVKTYDRVLLMARVRGQTTNDEALCRAAEQAHSSTREVLQRLLPATEEEAASERVAREGEFAELLKTTAADARRPLSTRARRVAAGSVLGVVAIAAAVYTAFLGPTFNYETMTQEQVRKLWPELTRGYVVKRPAGGRLFIGHLARQDQQAPTAVVARVSQKVMSELGPRGVSEVLILDRNKVPIGLMQGAR